MMNETKMYRLEARVSDRDKKLIEKAVLYSGFKSVSEFIITSSVKRAKEIIQEQEEFLISKRDAEIFFDAIINPDSANETLTKAFEEHENI